jgi:hypothetical protein
MLESVKSKVNNTINKGGPMDYLTFVPDGGSTLNKNLGIG